MNIKNNQRAQLTRNKIKEVFIEMLSSKAIHQITVQDICRKADVNRTTFYAHYDDIYDLMQKIETELWQGIMSVVEEPKSAQSESKEGRSHEALSEDRIEKLLDFILENASFYKIYLNDFSFIQNIDDRISSMWSVDVESLVGKYSNKSKGELQYQFEYFKSGMMGVIRTWLNAGCKESTKKMATIIKNCIYFK